MNGLLAVFGSPSWVSLVHALGHSLWIGAILALALAAFLRSVPARRHDLRYAVSLGALAALAVSVFVAWAVMDWRDESETARKVAMVRREPARGTAEMRLGDSEAPVPRSAGREKSVAVSRDRSGKARRAPRIRHTDVARSGGRRAPGNPASRVAGGVRAS